MYKIYDLKKALDVVKFIKSHTETREIATDYRSGTDLTFCEVERYVNKIVKPTGLLSSADQKRVENELKWLLSRDRSYRYISTYMSDSTIKPPRFVTKTGDKATIVQRLCVFFLSLFHALFYFFAYKIVYKLINGKKEYENHNTVNEKILQVMELEGLTSSGFAEKMGISRAAMPHILSGRMTPPLEVITKMLIRFPYINPDWLLFGAENLERDTNFQPSVNSNGFLQFTTKKL